MTNDDSGWKPVADHTMNEAEVRFALMEAFEVMLAAWCKERLAEGMPAVVVAALAAVNRAMQAKQFDHDVPNMMARMQEEVAARPPAPPSGTVH